MAVSAMSRRLLRAAGGLRRPSESRALPTFPSTIYFMMCVGLTSQPTCEREISPMQRRTKDPKTSAQVKPPETEVWGRIPRVGEDGFLQYRLALATILAVKVIIP
ncbi:hypothetical protein THAOC_08195, partial [Thalassiosira oceanica]